MSQAGDGVIWDFGSRKPLARFKYHGACQPTISSDRKMLRICGGDLVGMVPLVASLDRDGGSLFTAKFPHAEALATLDKARNDPGLFVLREGVDVAIDVSKVPGQYRQQVQASLEKQVAKMKCQVNPGAPLRLVAEITGPKSKEVRYMFAGTFTIQEYTSSLRFDYEGQTLWRRGTTNTPGMIGSTREKSMKQQIDEAGRKPNLGYFGAVSMPQYLQKPTQNSSGSGAAAGAALGASRVSR